MTDKEIFPTGLAEGVKTKTNYNLVGLVFGGFVAGLVVSCIWLSSPWKEILAVLFAIAILGAPYWIPLMMKQIPPSEQYKVSMAELGYYEKDGKPIPLKRLYRASAQNPHQLSPTPPNDKEDGAKE